MAENSWPKADGQIFYASEANGIPFGRKGSTGNYGSVWLSSGTTTLIRAINNNRHSISIFNNQSGTTIFVGPGGVDDTNGFTIGYGTAQEFLDTGSIYGYFGGAGSADVRYVEVAK